MASHAPSGWLVDRASGLRARTWYPDAAPRTSPLTIIYGGLTEQTVCEQHGSVVLRLGCKDICISRVLGSEFTFWGCMLGLMLDEQIIRESNSVTFRLSAGTDDQGDTAA